MKIGTVFEQTSTTEFFAMLDPQCDNERLLFSYVELSPTGGQPDPHKERIIARITNVHKENPLLSRDQAGISASVDLGGLGFDFSRRFTYGWAQCSVIGTLTAGRLDMNRRVVAPNAEVHTPSPETLRQLFFNSSPSCVPLGVIETYGEKEVEEVPVTLNADQLVTKHFCIFGMTGSGKTNTSAKLLEELMARGHRMIIFDSHDDYENLEELTNLYLKSDENGQRVDLASPVSHGQAVREAINTLQPTVLRGRTAKSVEEYVYERLIQTASVIYNNTPARQFLYTEAPAQQAVAATDQRITGNLVTQVVGQQPWSNLVKYSKVASWRVFPEIKYYGPDFQDFSIILLEAFQGESFSSAQWRCLGANISQQGIGITFLRNLWRAVGMDTTARQETRDVLQQMINRIQAIYLDAANAGAQPLELQDFFRRVASQKTSDPQIVYRLSLSDLSSNLRKAIVYAVVTYFFRSFKFGGNRAAPKNMQPANAFPILFVLEEARALIPRPLGADDVDHTGALARRAMRELAYEGRKFSLGFGLVSQKPSTVDQEVVSQSNTFILHQLKSPDDQDYVRSVTESMSRDELDMVKSLGTGRAIVAGVAVQSPVLLRVDPRCSEEGIEEPAPLRSALGSIAQIRRGLGVRGSRP